MTAAAIEFDNSYARRLDGLYVRWQPAQVPDPQLLALNEALAVELGLDPDWLRSADGVAVLAGNAVPPGADPVAQAYAGHQFGGYSPRLGDGRALLLGELRDVHGRQRDLHLKGSGRTPFSRGGDGKAAVAPMLREYLIGEAMHALGVPTTRALAVVATGEMITREGLLPGAVLARVAASHLRVGTFEYAARLDDPALLERLVRFAIDRHHPQADEASVPAIGLLDAVIEAQAGLVAQWMSVGFIHGVMNTDNMTISGETIDYGPCAFVDRYDPATVYSSIDHGGRYALGNQPRVAQWNLTRLAETLLGLIDADVDTAVAAATASLGRFPDLFRQRWQAAIAGKLGFVRSVEGDPALFDDLLAALHADGEDYTSFFRRLADDVRQRSRHDRIVTFGSGPSVAAWLPRWRDRLASEGRAADQVAAAIESASPLYVPRNHLVEEALAVATSGDVSVFERLLGYVTLPFGQQPGGEAYSQPAPDEFGRHYRTFCGT